jgi:hypothetical protein
LGGVGPNSLGKHTSGAAALKGWLRAWCSNQLRGINSIKAGGSHGHVATTMATNPVAYRQAETFFNMQEQS